jgi:hypothetical protein
MRAGRSIGAVRSQKTAFFLGLFMSRAEHEGKGLEEYMAPVSQRFLIPIFFVSLGMRIEWAVVLSWTGLMAFGAAGLLLGVREVLHRRWIPIVDDRLAYLLLCPNLTIVALGASTILEAQGGTRAAAWLLLTGLLMTALSIVSLPVTGKRETVDLRTSVTNQLMEEGAPDGSRGPNDATGGLEGSSLLLDKTVKTGNS